MAILRIILGVLAGVALGVGIVMLGDMANHYFWPPPADVQVTNPEAIRDYMQTAPITSLLALPVSWTLAGLAAAFVAAKIGARAWVGWIAGGFIFAATMANLAFIPHPLWMLVTSVVCVPLAVWIGAKFGAPRR